MQLKTIRQELVRLGDGLGYGYGGAVFEDVDRPSDPASAADLQAPTVMSMEVWKEAGRPVFVNVTVGVD